MAYVIKDQMNFTNTYQLQVIQAVDNEYFVLIVPTMNQRVGVGKINIQANPNGVDIEIYKTLAPFEAVYADGYPKTQTSPQTSQDSTDWMVPETDWVLHDTLTGVTGVWSDPIDTPCTGLRIKFAGTKPASGDQPVVYITIE